VISSFVFVILGRSPEGGRQRGAGNGRWSSQGGGFGLPPAGPGALMLQCAGWSAFSSPLKTRKTSFDRRR
jgi:hypothetical protein